MPDSKLQIDVNEVLHEGIEVSFLELKTQILKDYQLAGLDFNTDQIEDMASLIQWAADTCQHLIERDFSAYMNLLYRIDVPAERFISLNESESDYNSNEVAAGLVLKREIDKIRLRKTYQ